MKSISRLRLLLADAAAQKYWLAAGLILAIAGQSLIRDPQPFDSSAAITKYSTYWNKVFYLSLSNPANIMLGLFLITLAMIIFSRSFPSSSELKNEHPYNNDENWVSWKTFLPWVIASLSIYLLMMILLSNHLYSNWVFGAWLASLLSITLLFWKTEPQNKTATGFSITSPDGIWILALFAFAIAAGSYMLNDLPAGWIPDEGPFWQMARSIALGEKNPPFFDFGVFTFPVGSSLLQGWIMRWSGVNMWGWRFASVLPAALTVIPLYLLAHELFDRRVAIAANVMMIVNPYFLAFERLGYNNSQAMFPVTLCIYFLVLGIRKNSRFYFWLAGLTAGLGFYTYFAAWLGLVILIVIIMSLPLTLGIKFQKSLLPLAIIFAGMLMVFLPRVLYGMSGDTPILLHYKIWETGPINTFYGKYVFGEDRIAQAKIITLGNHIENLQNPSLYGNLVVDDQVEIFYDLQLYGILLVRGIVRSAAALFDPIGYVDHQIIFGLAGIGSSIFFVIGLGITFASFKKIHYFIPCMWFLAGFFFLGVLSSFPPRPTHLIAIIPGLALISAIGLVTFLDVITEKIPRVKEISVTGILLMIATISLSQFFFLTPYAYLPPNTDDYISWLGRQIPQPANIYLVDHYSTTRNPADESILKLSQHNTTFLTPSDLDSNPGRMKSWQNFVAFIEIKDGREYAEALAQKIPNAKVQTAYAPGERLRGYVVTDLNINASMDISLSYGLRDLWNSPARIILISCGIGIIALFLKHRRK